MVFHRNVEPNWPPHSPDPQFSLLRVGVFSS
jgi:hypothetical protein